MVKAGPRSGSCTGVKSTGCGVDVGWGADWASWGPCSSGWSISCCCTSACCTAGGAAGVAAVGTEDGVPVLLAVGTADGVPGLLAGGTADGVAALADGNVAGTTGGSVPELAVDVEPAVELPFAGDDDWRCGGGMLRSRLVPS